MEGKNFTLRLSGEEVEALERLRNNVGVATDTAAVRHAIMNFVEIENTKQMQAKEIEKLKKESNYFRKIGYALINSLKTMSEIIGEPPTYTWQAGK